VESSLVDDDYELIPKHELDALRKEIERIRKNPLGDLPEGETLLDEVKSLNSNIKKLVDIFANTESDLAKEYAEHNPLEEMKSIKEQNSQIAQGILALSDILKEVKEQNEKIREEQTTKQVVSNTPLDQYGLPLANPPQPDSFILPDLNSPMGLPPQPSPIPEKKKGLFGR
jgi:hypothetical protein